MSETRAPAGEHRLTRALRELLQRRRTAALGTLDPQGQAFVSLVPFAIDSAARQLVIHISALAAHTQHLRAQPLASLMVCDAEPEGEPVHALARVSLAVRAHFLERADPAAALARQTYLQRFPEAEPITALGDFQWVTLQVLGARQVAGFGAARSLTAEEVERALALGSA